MRRRWCWRICWRAKQVEAELRETKAELRETKMEVVALRAKVHGAGFVWTAEENAALLELVDEYGIGFVRAKTEAGARLGGRKAKAIDNHFRRAHPDRFRELRDLGGGGKHWHRFCLDEEGRRGIKVGIGEVRQGLGEDPGDREGSSWTSNSWSDSDQVQRLLELIFKKNSTFAFTKPKKFQQLIIPPLPSP